MIVASAFGHESFSPVVLLQAVGILLSGLFLFYVGFLLLPTRVERRVSERATDLDWHFFVPARDEAIVIGNTVEHLRDWYPDAHVWVIDDASTDRTADIVSEIAAYDPHVHLVQRRLPHARIGKGDALNSAYRALMQWLPRDRNPARVIVGVIDADGRPSRNCLDVCAGTDLLGDPAIGGVQVEVRMINRNDRKPILEAGRAANFFARQLIRMQDIEFRAVAVAMQRSRSRWTKTAGMGGNGQFTRLSALCDLDTGDGVVWRNSLIEDFELGLHLLLAGWATAFTSRAWVDQEALFSLRRFLTQRTRWSQGVMQNFVNLGRVWRSPRLKMAGVIELTYSLLQPWLAMLGLVIVPGLLALIAFGPLAHSGPLHNLIENYAWAILLGYAVLGLGPFIVWGCVYRYRCARDRNFFVGVGWGLTYFVYVSANYVTAWRAFGRIAFKRQAWTKTRRNDEVMAAEPVQVAHVRALIEARQFALADHLDAGQGASGLEIDWSTPVRTS